MRLSCTGEPQPNLQSAHDAILPLSLGLDGHLHLYPHPQGLFSSNITDASRNYTRLRAI